MSALLSKHTDPAMQGRVFGLNHMLMSLSRVLGPAIATAAYSRHHTSPYALAGAITLGVAIWTISLRTASAAQAQQPGFVVSPAGKG